MLITDHLPEELRNIHDRGLPQDRDILVLGERDNFRTERLTGGMSVFSGYWLTPEANTWRLGTALSGRARGIYAVDTSSVVAQNFLSTAMAIPDNGMIDTEFGQLPPIPDGWVLIGHFDRDLVTEFDMEEDAAPVVSRLFNPSEAEDGTNQEWSDPDLFYFYDTTNVFLVPEDSTLAALNPNRVRRLNPQLAAEPEPEQEATQPVNQSASGQRIWALLVNGVPIADRDELVSTVSTLAINPDEASINEVVETLWKSLEYDNPEQIIEPLVEREPMLAMVEFRPIATAGAHLVPAVIESNRSVGEIMVAAAAGVLLRGGLSNHFVYQEDGSLIINPDSPPTLDQGLEMLRRTIELKESGEKMENYSAWTIGMVGAQLEAFFEDDYDPSLVMAATERSYNTYITSLTVFKQWWANRKNISFTHHKEVHYAKIEGENAYEAKVWILDLSERLRLKVAQQRKVVSYVRVFGHQPLQEWMEENPGALVEDLMQRLEARSANRNYLFYLPTERKWFKYRGPFEMIPNGANPILNTESGAILQPDGFQKLSDWKPVGVEMPQPRGHRANIERASDAVLEEINQAIREAEEVESTQEEDPEESQESLPEVEA